MCFVFVLAAIFLIAMEKSKSTSGVDTTFGEKLFAVILVAGASVLLAGRYIILKFISELKVRPFHLSMWCGINEGIIASVF